MYSKSGDEIVTYITEMCTSEKMFAAVHTVVKAGSISNHVLTCLS